jgi:hypothetical protein
MARTYTPPGGVVKRLAARAGEVNGVAINIVVFWQRS